MSTAAAPVVHTRAGTVRGRWQTETSAGFLGIPYAEAPTGSLRFAPPVSRSPWDGVFDATSYAATAQRTPMSEVTAIPEPSIPGDDYLCLNVFTPAPGDEAARLPVYVWIHGGGFSAGSPASPWYDGRAFTRDGVVTVSIGYRLGFVGFGHLDDAVDNRGVLDWICALEWVRDNIAAFGGDPGAVTIGGQSAGGGAVLTLLGCEKAQPLFHRAIANSAPASIIPLDFAREVGAQVAKECGVEPTAEAMSTLDEQAVLDAQNAVARSGTQTNPLGMLRLLVRGEPGVLRLCPVADGDLLTETTLESLRRGVGAGKPLLMGSTANEFNQVASLAPAIANMVPAAPILRAAGLPRGAARDYVAARAGLRSMALLGQFLTDITFHVTLVRDCVAHEQSWAYLFDWGSPAAGGLSPHCLELPFVWDCLDAEHVEQNTGPRPPQALADEMHGAWVRFIKDGDPGWPAYADARAVRVFDESTSTVPDAYGVARQLADAVG